MNWKLLMLTLGQMPVYLAPVDDDRGGGENVDDNDDDTDTDDDDTDTDDDDDDDTDDDDDDTDDDDDDDDDDENLGKGAQKRIRQLNERMKAAESRTKDLEKQLEDAKKLSGDDGRALLAAAEASGILPGLMTKDEAEAFQDLVEIPRIIERYQDWLDDSSEDDELAIGDRNLSRGDVKKRVRKLRDKLDDLKDRYGDRRKDLMAKVRGIFETGLAAQKAGWKPDGKKTPANKKERKKLHDKPTGKNKPSVKPGKKQNWGDVDGEDSFVRMIASQKNDND